MNWLDNYNNSKVSIPEGMVGEGYSTKGRNYSPAWGGQFQMGGNVYPVNYVPDAQMGASIPGAVGFSYARVAGSAPSNGPYAKKTKASAQNGQEMKYYQEGLDWKPKSMQKGGKAKKLKDEREQALAVRDNVQMPVVNKKNIRPLTEAEKKERVRQQIIDRQGEITQSVPQSTLSRAKEIALNPLTAFGYVARNEELPENFSRGDRNLMDDAIDFVNPAFYVDSGINLVNNQAQVFSDLSQGNFSDAGINQLMAGAEALNFIPIAKQAKPFVKKGIQQLEKIPTSISPELRQGVNSQGFFDFFKRKSKSDEPMNRLITSQDLSLKDFTSASNELLDFMKDKKNIYRDVYQSEIKRHNRLLKDIEQGEGWKYSADDIINSEKTVNDADKTYRQILDYQTAEFMTNPKYFDNTKDNLIYFKGKNSGKHDLKEFTKNTPEQWYGIQEYKGVRPNVEGYISDVEDYMNDPKYKLPGNRFNRELLLKDMATDGGEGFYNLYKNNNWKPDFKDIPLNKNGGVTKDNNGYWNPDNWGKPVEIDSNKITMKGVNQPLLGVSDEGDVQMMYPEEEYEFIGEKVTEFPMAKNGLRQEQKGLINLDQLTNFTNYNTKQPGGWLDKY